MTDSDDDDLTSMRVTIFREAIKFDPRPGRAGSLVALANSIAALVQSRTQARAEM